MSVMIEGLVARGVVTGKHPAFQRAHSTMCYPSLDTPLRWSGAAVPSTDYLQQTDSNKPAPRGG